jgi:hypothetical protein
MLVYTILVHCITGTKIEMYVLCRSYIANIEGFLKARDEKQLKSKTSCVLPSDQKPEMDVTDLLTEQDAGYYQSQIGILRWVVELGRIDIATEMSTLAAFSAAPRHGHMAAILHLYAYFKAHDRSRLVLDPSYLPAVTVPEYDWTDFTVMWWSKYHQITQSLVVSQPRPQPLWTQIMQLIWWLEDPELGYSCTSKVRPLCGTLRNRGPLKPHPLGPSSQPWKLA